MTKKRQKIDAKTDYNILADILLGMTSKEAASKYGVSVSYISKVRTGRKQINVYIPEQIKQDQHLIYHKPEVDRLEQFFDSSFLSLVPDVEEVLENLIMQKVLDLKALIQIRKNLKGE